MSVPKEEQQLSGGQAVPWGWGESILRIRRLDSREPALTSVKKGTGAVHGPARPLREYNEQFHNRQLPSRGRSHAKDRYRWGDLYIPTKIAIVDQLAASLGTCGSNRDKGGRRKIALKNGPRQCERYARVKVRVEDWEKKNHGPGQVGGEVRGGKRDAESIL